MPIRPRVLLIAESANPEWPSVPLVGWSLARAISNLADAHLVTHVRNRRAILAAGLTEGPGKDFTAIDNETVSSPLWKLGALLRGGKGKGWTTLTAFSAISYYSFERELWKQFKSRLFNREFDLVHRITPLSPTHQSPIAAKLAKLHIPFVIGPLNGGLPWPKQFVDRQHAEHDWLSHVRGLYKLMPHYSATRRCASAILVGSKYTQSEIPKSSRHKCVFIPENAVDPSRFSRIRRRKASLPLRGCFVGRLVPYKGADMLIEAAANFLRRGVLELHIVGDGPEKSRLVDLSSKLKVAEHVHFHGLVAHEAVQDILSDCDFLALPSIREFGGGVVVEAMALGVAPVVADYGGPSELVDEATGRRIAFTDRDSLVSGLTNEIGKFVSLPQVLDTLGLAAREKVQRSLTWDAKAQQIMTVYNSVLNGQKDLSRLSFFEASDQSSA